MEENKKREAEKAEGKILKSIGFFCIGLVSSYMLWGYFNDPVNTRAMIIHFLGPDAIEPILLLLLVFGAGGIVGGAATIIRTLKKSGKLLLEMAEEDEKNCE